MRLMPIFTILPLLAFSTVTAFADPTAEGNSVNPPKIVNCNGTWQNKPCPETISSTLPAVTEHPASAVSKTQSKRKVWLHDLEMMRLKAKREHHITFSTSDAEAICNQDATTDIQCQQIISTKTQELTATIQQAEHLKLEQERVRIEQEKLKKPAGDGTTNIAEDNRTVIFIRPNDRKSHTDWKSPSNHPIINGSKGASSSEAATDSPQGAKSN